MQELGKHFIVGVQGAVLLSEERTLWQKLRPLGVIIFKRNVAQTADWRPSLRDLILELKELSGRDDFIASIDHEGGRVHRLSPPITLFPAAKNWKGNSFAVGAAMGRELASLGINLNFAPSFDVLTQTNNKVIGERAFSSEPETVLASGLAFLQGLESEGVLGCAKHFPGHGGTLEDSHYALPSIELSKEELDTQELLPFKGYIESGRKLIMTAHVVYKALDLENPATLSKAILSGLLRDELGFQGAIITDALDMGALSKVSPAEVATKFIKAGGDLFCVCQDTNDKNSEGKKLTPIQAALAYSDALSLNSEIADDLARSLVAIELFLTELRRVEKLAKKTLSEAEITKAANLVQLITSGNA